MITGMLRTQDQFTMSLSFSRAILQVKNVIYVVIGLVTEWLFGQNVIIERKMQIVLLQKE